MSALLTITEGNKEVTADIPENGGFYHADRETFDSLTFKEAMAVLAETNDGYPEWNESIAKVKYAYDRDTFRVLVRIMGAMFKPPALNASTESDWHNDPTHNDLP